MSIYAEYAHGCLGDDEFAQGVRDEEWLSKCRTDRDEVEDAFNDMQSDAFRKMEKSLEDICTDCDWGENDWCGKCVVDRMYRLLEGDTIE